MNSPDPTPDFSQGVAFVRGRYVPIAEAAIPITDWGFLRSDAAYDVVTVWDGAFFRLDAHLERFHKSCARFRLDPGLSSTQITDILAQCVRLSGLKSSYVEMICTRGQPPWGSRDPRQAVNQFYAFAVPYVWIANEEQRQRGLHLQISDVERISSRSVDPTAKNYHWNDMTMGLLGALDAGAETVVLTDGAGNVVEGPGFNIFSVKNGVITTPDRGVLEGITRRTVIEMAQSRGIPVQLASLSADALRASDEVFLSTSGGGVLPVTRVDNQPIASGKPEPVTQALTALYWDWHREPRYSTPIGYFRDAKQTLPSCTFFKLQSSSYEVHTQSPNGSGHMDQETAENFNSQMRDFGETANHLVNYLLLVSGGILSITIGAFLAKPPPLNPSELMWVRWGWGFLTTSIVCTLLSFCILMIAKRLVIQGFITRIKGTTTGLILVQGPIWLRWVIASVFLIGFSACIAGIICTAYGASGLLHSRPGAT